MTYEIEMREFGADCRTELVIKRDGVEIGNHLDGGEPEDNYFSRDWRWVNAALLAAYEFGVTDGEAKRE